MTRHLKLSLHVLLMVMTILSCGQFVQPPATPTPGNILERTNTLAARLTSGSTDTTAAPGLTLSAALPTDRPRTPTRTLPPTATYPPVDPGPFRRVTSLAEPFPNLFEEVQVRAPADGTVWVITSRTIARWDGQAWNLVRSMEEDMLADVDENGRLWLFRQDADEIAVWEDDRWTTYGIDSGWTRAHASAGPGWWAPKPWKVSVAADGTVWLPTEADVRQFDGRRWTIHALEDMGFPVPEWEEEGIVHQIALVEGGDQVWVGECQYSGPGPVSHPGVRWFDGHSWQGADSPLGQTCVSVVDTDRAGNVWMGAQNGVWRYEPGRQKWTAYALPESLRSGYNFTYTRDLMTDNSGDIWVYMQCCAGASCDANTILFRIHDGKWSKVFERLEWFLPLQQLALDGKGQGWLFWGGSVYQLLEEEVPAVAEMPARGMAVSPDGKIWVAAGHESDAALWISEP